jgi:hypothetical protein
MVESFAFHGSWRHCQRLFCSRGMAYVQDIEVAVAVLLAKHVHHPVGLQPAEDIPLGFGPSVGKLSVFLGPPRDESAIG